MDDKQVCGECKLFSGGLKGKLVNYNKIVHFHPTWETAYYNEKWEFIKDYRTK